MRQINEKLTGFPKWRERFAEHFLVLMDLPFSVW